ncbi:MAG: hypothetical protein ACYDES_14400 [Acidimicrobiales bacterium]
MGIRGIRSVIRLVAAVAAAFVAAAGLVIALPQSAAAVALPTFSFSPVSQPGAIAPRGDFRYDLRAGQTINDSVVLTNETSQLQDFQIWPTDGYNTTVGGAFALRPLGYPMTGVGTWIDTHLGTGVYGLPGNSSVTINFSLTVPANATPGDHAGGIEALNVTPVPQPTGGPAHFIIHRGIATAVFVRVAGPVRPSAAVSNISVVSSVPALGFGNRQATIKFQVENTGNTLLAGEAVVTVTDLFGRTVKTFRPISIQAFVPGGRFTAIEPVWHNLPLFGPETVHVKVTSPGMAAATGQATFWIFPWLLVLIVLVLLALIVWRLWIWRKHRAASAGGSGGTEGPGSVGPDAPEGPTAVPETPVGAGT